MDRLSGRVLIRKPSFTVSIKDRGIKRTSRCQGGTGGGTGGNCGTVTGKTWSCYETSGGKSGTSYSGRTGGKSGRRCGRKDSRRSTCPGRGKPGTAVPPRPRQLSVRSPPVAAAALPGPGPQLPPPEPSLLPGPPPTAPLSCHLKTRTCPHRQPLLLLRHQHHLCRRLSPRV